MKHKNIYLNTLTPAYIEESHLEYLNILKNGIDNNDVRNIALSGDFSTGKSSVLNEFQKQNNKRCVTVSVTTLGNSMLENNIFIEQEIANQLLSVRPKNRISTLNSLKKLSLAPVLTIVILVTLIDLSLDSKILSQFNFSFRSRDDYAILIILISIILGSTLAFLVSNLRVKSINLSGFLFDSYHKGDIDKNLDLITEHIRKNGIEIVIFEDLDRFDEWRIFDQLRSLNQVLNLRINKKITFIYATKQPSSSDVNPRYWVKFFDLIISIKPFISSNNSIRFLADKLASTPWPINGQSLAVKLLSTHNTDIRVLNQIVNEYQIIAKDKRDQGKEHLERYLICAAYKILFPEEYRLLPSGKSSLDRIKQEVDKTKAEIFRNEIKIEELLSLNEPEESRKLLAQGYKVFEISWANMISRPIQGIPEKYFQILQERLTKIKIDDYFIDLIKLGFIPENYNFVFFDDEEFIAPPATLTFIRKYIFRSMPDKDLEDFRMSAFEVKSLLNNPRVLNRKSADFLLNYSIIDFLSSGSNVDLSAGYIKK